MNPTTPNYALDRAVAREIFGWEWNESQCHVCGWPLKEGPAGCKPGDCSLRPRPLVAAAEITTEYSTNAYFHLTSGGGDAEDARRFD